MEHPYSVAVEIPGRCQTKNSWTGAKGYGRKGKGYEKAMNWEAVAKQHATAQLHKQGAKELPVYGRMPVQLFVSVSVKGKRRADLQNYFKSICDAMNHILYHDDRQIYVINGRLKEVSTEEEQCTKIVCFPFTNDSTKE